MPENNLVTDSHLSIHTHDETNVGFPVQSSEFWLGHVMTALLM